MRKKIGFFEEVEIYLADDKPLCPDCAKPVYECYIALYTKNAEELVEIENNLNRICEGIYDKQLSEMIVKKFRQKRMERGLMTDGEQEELKRRDTEFEERVNSLPMTTTPNFEGYKIEKYIDVICEEVIFKNSFLKRLDAGIEDIANVLSFRQTELTGANELIQKAREYTLDKFKRSLCHT